MLDTFCTECGNRLGEGEKYCAKCGTPTDLAGEPPDVSARVQAGAAAPRSGHRWFPGVIFLIVLLAILVTFLGNVRFVSGAPHFIVKRQYFGFSDMFGSVADCTSGPWVAVSAAHGPLCADLQAAGILESDEEMEARTRKEILRQADSMTRAIERQLRG